MVETIAPRPMKHPFRHCLYCLWQYVLLSILIFLLFVVGIFSPMWAFLLNIVASKGEAAIMLPFQLTGLNWVGVLSISIWVNLLFRQYPPVIGVNI